MFRIKTDIRQYKCETKDKVEKLIRNWVIRPSDLIYDADGKEWAPIGAHPAFVGLFGILDEQEQNTPDTVVTARSSVQSNGTATPDEVTRLVGRPLVAESEAEDVRQTDVFDEDEVAVSLAELDAQREAEAEAEPEISDADASESESEEASEESEPVPPEAPAGVELPTHDGEVTMMTERTLQMLKITDEDDAVTSDSASAESIAEEEAEAPPSADEPASEPAEEVTSVRPEETAEVTSVREEEAKEVTSVREEETPEEVTSVREEEAKEVTSVREEEAPEEVTSVRALDEDEKSSEDDPIETPESSESEEVEKVKVAKTEKKPSAVESGPKLGRHDLPEELFATNEISSPEVQEHLKRLDELGELDPSAASDESDEEEVVEEGGVERLDTDSAVDEAWDLVAEDLGTTEEIDSNKHESTEPSGDQPDDFDEDDDMPELEAIPVSAEDFVSDGYKIPLPYPVGPTDADIRRGMPSGKVSEALKERTFPRPEPKKLNEIHRREFALIKPPPRDHTWAILAVVIILLLMISVGVASC